MSELQPVFKACHTDTNFEKLFLKSVHYAVYAQPQHSTAIPLAEALLDIELSQHQIQPKQTRLFIFSNFLQNSQNLSFAQSTDLKAAINQFKLSRLGGVQRPTFINTTAYLHIIPPAQLTENLLNIRDGFWIWFFEICVAIDVHMVWNVTIYQVHNIFRGDSSCHLQQKGLPSSFLPILGGAALVSIIIIWFNLHIVLLAFTVTVPLILYFNIVKKAY
jgi:hypothetical protein